MGPSGLPLTDPDRAWDLMLKHLPEFPAWPRLPRRSFLENPDVQLCERFPGVVFEDSHIYIEDIWERDPALDHLYIAYLGQETDYGRISPEYAACLGRLIDESVRLPHTTTALKGQIMGPLSWALTVLDQDGGPILYNEDLLDVVSQHLRLKAAWQEHVLRHFVPVTVMLLEEPLLTPTGLASLPIETERVLALLEDVLGGMSGLKGIHCTVPVDSSVLCSISANVLSLDVSDVSDSSDLSVADLRDFIGRGGLIVWGIVPAQERVCDEKAEELADRLQGWLDSVVGKGVTLDTVVAASIVSTSSGLESAEVEVAERALALTAEVSQIMRARHI